VTPNVNVQRDDVSGRGLLDPSAAARPFVYGRRRGGRGLFLLAVLRLEEPELGLQRLGRRGGGPAGADGVVGCERITGRPRGRGFGDGVRPSLTSGGGGEAGRRPGGRRRRGGEAGRGAGFLRQPRRAQSGGRGGRSGRVGFGVGLRSPSGNGRGCGWSSGRCRWVCGRQSPERQNTGQRS